MTTATDIYFADLCNLADLNEALTFASVNEYLAHYEMRYLNAVACVTKNMHGLWNPRIMKKAIHLRALVFSAPRNLDDCPYEFTFQHASYFDVTTFNSRSAEYWRSAFGFPFEGDIVRHDGKQMRVVNVGFFTCDLEEL